MATLQEFRKQYPQYQDMPDDVLAEKLHQKFYSKMPRDEFDVKLGIKQEPYSGTLLPFSKDAQGNVSFDSNAGVLGLAKGLVTGVDDVMTGRVDPKSDEGIASITNAAMVGTPVSAGTRGGLGWAGAKLNTRAPVKTPTGGELQSTSGFGFDMARQMDVRYKPSAVQNMVLKLRSQLHAKGFRKSNAERSFAELEELSKPVEPGAFATIDDLHAVRQALSKAGQNFNNATDQDAAVQIINAIDDFITKPDPASVMGGPAAAAAGVWKDAMGNYAAGKRSDKLVDKPFSLEEKAERRAAATNSGLNKDNTVRTRVASLLDNPKTRSGFNEEEIALLETVANGTAARNITRFIGNLLGGGGGLAAMATGLGSGAISGSSIPAIVGTAVVGLGVGAKTLGSQLTKRSLNKTAEAVRQRSPLYQDRAATAPVVQPTSPAVRSVVPRAAGGSVATQPGEPIGGGIFPTDAMKAQPPLTREQIEQYLQWKRAVDRGA